MKKTVIANWGHADQGKSETVKKVAQLLIQLNSNVELEPSNIDFSKDIRVIITIDGIKYGIESMGDPNSRLFSSLPYFVEQNCDFIICSTRTSGATVDKVNALRKDGYDIIWVTNHRSRDRNKELLNQLSAKNILELIKEILMGNI